MPLKQIHGTSSAFGELREREGEADQSYWFLNFCLLDTSTSTDVTQHNSWPSLARFKIRFTNPYRGSAPSLAFKIMTTTGTVRTLGKTDTQVSSRTAPESGMLAQDRGHLLKEGKIPEHTTKNNA